MRQHDKSILTSMNFLENINNRKVDKLQSARTIVHDIVNKRLKEEDSFSNMPFEWLSGMEYYGNFPNVIVELKRLNKKHKELGFEIVVPMKEIKELAEKEESEIVQFYLHLFNSAIELALKKYQ